MTTRAQISAGEEYKDDHTPLMRAALAGDTETVRAFALLGFGVAGGGISREVLGADCALMFAGVFTKMRSRTKQRRGV